MRLLYPVRLDSFFAQAGQSVVERAVLAEVLSLGLAVRMVAFGDSTEQARVARDVGARHAALEIIPAQHAAAPDVLDGVDALLLHSLPLEDVWVWLRRVRPIEALPTVHYVHSLLLAPFEQVMWAELYRAWSGVPPARLVAPSESTAVRARTLASEAARRGGRMPPVVVIPHGVDATAISAGDRAEARARLGIGARDLVVLSVGRITPQKAAYAQLVLAFDDAARTNPRIRLVLAGAVAEQDKPYVALLERQARRLGLQDRVRVIENFDESEKASIYAAGDVFASLANDPQESFGVALLEAAAAGLPVLATHWDGYPEALPRVYGPRLVPTVASHTLARELDWTVSAEACAPVFAATAVELGRLLGSESLRATLVAEGLPFARQRTWGRAASALVTLLELLVADAGGTLAAPAMPAASMVAGLATRYLDDDPRLRTPARAASWRRRRRARWLAARPLRGGPPHGRPAWSDDATRRGQRAVLIAAAAAGPAGLPASALRRHVDLPDPQADLVLLRLLTYGLLDVVSGEA